MSKLKLCFLAVIVFSFVVAGPASAATYTFQQSDLLNMVLSWDNGGEGDLDSVTVDGAGVMFSGDIPINDTTAGDGFYSIGIGFPWGSVPQGDLSGYDQYKLFFENKNDDAWMVNLYMNTGWTDAPWSEDNNYYENGWVLLNPGESVTLTLSLIGLENLNHVTNIGFQIATDREWADHYHMSVSSVPVPAAFWLLGSGLIGLAGLRKKLHS